MPTPITAAIGNSQYAPGASDANDRAARQQREPGQQHRPRAAAVDDETRGELRHAAGSVEDPDQQPQQRPGHIELGAQQREERRQSELEEVRECVRGTDEADNADVAAERLGGNGF